MLVLGTATLGTTDKSYKLYVNGPDGVSSLAGIRGAGKFYSWHAPHPEDDPQWWEVLRSAEKVAREKLAELERQFLHKEG